MILDARPGPRFLRLVSKTGMHLCFRVVALSLDSASYHRGRDICLAGTRVLCRKRLTVSWLLWYTFRTANPRDTKEPLPASSHPAGHTFGFPGLPFDLLPRPGMCASKPEMNEHDMACHLVVNRRVGEWHNRHLSERDLT
jgi:hypothetical protein